VNSLFVLYICLLLISIIQFLGAVAVPVNVISKKQVIFRVTNFHVTGYFQGTHQFRGVGVFCVTYVS
jgi:hypothetical protein